MNPALQVFEKKASSKAAEQEQTPSQATAVPQTPPEETVTSAGQRKSLLDGVTLR
ncbi:MAG: hypothetical protein HC851_23520 [Acaryochloris sp. RU_4_1]|nr:hypothetical protein [Acaryochloris sp. RU_4_1]NJR56820.1 hypothetical protein [Acaryochloris sp. CRU_2_0]